MQLPTPLERAPEALSRERALFLKREDAHDLGAFKWRGALPTLEAYRARGSSAVVTASTGNHGAATAWAAKRLAMHAIVYVPRGASRTKLDVLVAQAADIREVGADLDDAKDAARTFAAGSGLPFFEDGAEPAQLAGYGAIAEEILTQSKEIPGTIVVPVGNGALLAGIGEVLARLSPSTSLIGVVSAAAPVMALSFEAGRAVGGVPQATFADGLAVRVAIPEAVERVRRVADDVRLVSEREIAGAVGAYALAGIRVEGAAAAALALLRKSPELPAPVILILTGRNIDDDLHRRAVEDPDSFPA